MLTGDSMEVDEAYRLGMVSKVFPPDELADRTLEFARRIAKIPTMAALLVKEAVNQTQDNMGFYNSLKACFTLHELNHAHWMVAHSGDDTAVKPASGVPGRDVPVWKGTKIKVAERNSVEAT
jgi:enoyl-CoA hydratase